MTMYSLNFENDKYKGLYVEMILAGADVMVYLCEKSEEKAETICKVELFTVSSALEFANRLAIPIVVGE
ncbi:hypothetical protein HMPREF9098_2239 [Kingella denitrificans ATCC 33394]|uniref:Uncharacterized protein n=2 Tax=Kingella denitrificans TaxID=502 RepID=F0F2A4_9NEIS|nr:hypothetical protein HMPREF9098_2239 [Kingella denitrificans ATCC 33394]